MTSTRVFYLCFQQDWGDLGTWCIMLNRKTGWVTLLKISLVSVYYLNIRHEEAARIIVLPIVFGPPKSYGYPGAGAQMAALGMLFVLVRDRLVQLPGSCGSVWRRGYRSDRLGVFHRDPGWQNRCSALASRIRA